MRIRDLATGRTCPTCIEGTHYGTAWSADERYLFYTPPGRRHAARTRCGATRSGRPRPTTCSSTRRTTSISTSASSSTRSGAFVVIDIESRTTTEVLARLGRRPTAAAPQLVAARQPGRRVPHRPLGRPLRHRHQPRRRRLPGRRGADRHARTGRVGRRSCPTDPDVRITQRRAVRRPRRRCTSGRTRSQRCGSSVATASERIAGATRGRALRRPRRQPRVRHATLRLHLPVARHAAVGVRRGLCDGRAHCCSSRSRCSAGTTRPSTIGAASGRRRRDGTTVPVDSSRRRDIAPDGTNPAVALRLRLLRGSHAAVVLVDATVAPRPRRRLGARPLRGGGELGRRWYLDGKLLHKRNTFTDFIACAEHLVAAGLRPRRTARAPRRQRRRPARRAPRHHATRLFAARRRRGALRRRREHDARPDAPADRHRVGGVGQPARAEPYASVHARYSPYDNVPTAALPGACSSPPGSTTRGSATTSRPSGWPSSGRRPRPAATAAADRDRRRAWRPVGPLRDLARRGPGARVRPGELGHHQLTAVPVLVHVRDSCTRRSPVRT